MFGMVYIVFLISHIWDWGGACCILDGLSYIVYSEFDILEENIIFGGRYLVI